MKKFWICLGALVLVLMLTVLPQDALTQTVQAATSGDYTYTVSGGKATITDFSTSYSGALTIPSTLGGYPVTSIGNYAFQYCSGLTSITIPDSVTSIGEHAFNCTGLTSITIPDSVTSIGYSAFYSCFGLTSVTIGNSVTSIGSYAFYGCTGLTSITIPDSVTSIGSYAFYGCTGLTSVHITDLAAWCAINFDRYSSNPLYYANNLYLNGKKVTDLVILDSVTSIGDYAFDGCSGLTSVTIGNSVTSIGSGAFRNCTGLTSVTIPDSVTSIGKYAFNCTGLTSITIPDSVTSIGSGAFYGCTSLESMTLPFVGGSATSNTFLGYIFGASYSSNNANYVPTSLKTIILSDACTGIGDYAFQYCSGLTSVTIGNSVTSIGYDAFRNCTGLTSITIPDSVTGIGSYAFSGCTSLENMTLPFVGGSATSNTFLGYIFGASYSSNNANYVPTSLKTIILSDACTGIGDYAFQYCFGLTSVTIGNSVTSIGDYAFENCTGLTSITIPDSVASIGSGAFYGCTGLTSVHITDLAAWCAINFDGYSSNPLYYANNLYLNEKKVTDLVIPDSVTSIGDYAFYGCTGLTSVTIGNSVTSIGKYAFNCTGLTSITIPDSVTSIGSGAFYGCTSLESMTLPFVGGSATSNTFLGYIFGASYSSNNDDYVPTSLKTIILSDACTGIGDYAFQYCSGLTSITIPDSVTSIGSYAFYGCTGLTSVHITDLAAWCAINFDRYSSNPLYYANNLYLNGKKVTDLVILDSVTSIGDYAFDGCTGLTSITIPDSVTSIGSSAFYGCTGLTSVTIGNSVTSIGYDAFRNCTGLTSVRFYSRSTMVTCKSAFDSSVSILCLCKDDQHAYSQESDATCNVCMYSRTPSAPIADSITDTSITLQKMNNYEYKMDGGEWTTNPIFTGLNPNTAYVFYQRVAETDTTYVSESSVATTVTTLKSTVEAPNAPMVSGKTDTTITLVAVDGYEYKMNDGEWTTNPIFTGLTPNKEYTFYQRVAETKTTYVSESSVATTVTTLKSTVEAPNAPMVSGKTDTTITLVAVDGYEYKMNDGKWTTNPIFTGLTPNKEYTFYQRVAETKTTYVSESSVATTVTTLKSTVEAPNAPMVSGKTDTTITLVAVDGYEYKMGNGFWTANPIFTGLNPNKEYTFYQRVAETDTTYVSAVSEATKVTTLKSTVAAPAAPIIAEKTDTIVTLQTVLGYEYKMDDGAWTTDPVFTDLDPETEYSFYQRVAETETTYASASSVGTKVTTEASFVPGWFSDNGVWYYYNMDGTLATGWLFDGAWYYMDANGVMLTGWVYDGAWYYMNSSGVMQTGWLYDGAWYYLNASGAMATGWVNDGGTWYYMNSGGAMMTGWVNDGGTWYYMNSSGAMMTGWVNDGGTWYYMNSSGAMATGWVNDGGTWYYMNPNGAMATGWILDGGVWYYLDASGAWVA